eukprot:1363286-Amorphochlora_amoeboformis.AAC.2
MNVSTFAYCKVLILQKIVLRKAAATIEKGLRWALEISSRAITPMKLPSFTASAVEDSWAKSIVEGAFIKVIPPKLKYCACLWVPLNSRTSISLWVPDSPGNPARNPASGSVIFQARLLQQLI